MDTTIELPVENNSCHSKPNLTASSPDSVILQSSPHTAFSFQSKSPVTTSQPTTPRVLPRTSSNIPTNFPSTSTGITPRSGNARTQENETFLASGRESLISKISPFYFFLY